MGPTMFDDAGIAGSSALSHKIIFGGLVGVRQYYHVSGSDRWIDLEQKALMMVDSLKVMEADRVTTWCCHPWFLVQIQAG